MFKIKILKNNIKSELNIRTEKDFPIKGIEFIDINPLLIQPDTLEEITNLFIDEIKHKKIDYIVVPEARGFLIGTAVANKLKKGLIPVRKKGKIPPTTIAKEFEYEKEYGKDMLVLPKLIKDEYKNKNFYIIDDIYATGNTAQSIKKAIEELEGNVIGIGTILNIVELNNDDIFSLINVNEE